MSQAATLTIEGMIVGPLLYKSSEPVKGLKVDRRSDLYSLGVVLYEMVTARRPLWPRMRWPS
ncbi:MAG: hypothetical protein H8E35_13375 [Ardenticatenia bacterium]|nr:hypothetical protein [Ardenticatenia bacterium]